MGKTLFLYLFLFFFVNLVLSVDAQSCKPHNYKCGAFNTPAPESSPDVTTFDKLQQCTRRCARQGMSQAVFKQATSYSSSSYCSCDSSQADCNSGNTVLSTGEAFIPNCITLKEVQETGVHYPDVTVPVCPAFCSVHGFSYAVFGGIPGCGCINRYDIGTCTPVATNIILATQQGLVGCFKPPVAQTTDKPFSMIKDINECKRHCAGSEKKFAQLLNVGCRCVDEYVGVGPACPTGLTCDVGEVRSLSNCLSPCVSSVVNSNWESVDMCGGDTNNQASMFIAVTKNGFSVYNFADYQNGGPVGRHINLVGDAKRKDEFFVDLTYCREGTTSSFNNLFTNISPRYWSTGGIWAVPLQIVTNYVEFYFTFAVDPCLDKHPTGSIALVVADPTSTQWQHIRPYPNLNDDYTGIPNAIIFALRLGSETNPTLVVSKTDCVGTIVATTSFTLASQFPLYAINTFTVKGTSTLTIKINAESFTVQRSNFPLAPPLETGKTAQVAAVGIIANHGRNGDGLFSVESFRFHNCILGENETPGSSDGFELNCAMKDVATWTNSFNKVGVSGISALSSVSLAVREPFPEDGVIECVAEAYDGAPEPCHNVEAEANLMFPFVSSLPEKASGGVVKAKLLTLESPGISTWSITGDWNYWPLPVFAQRDVKVTVKTSGTDFASQIYLPKSHVYLFAI